jgi:hypothetical protein
MHLSEGLLIEFCWTARVAVAAVAAGSPVGEKCSKAIIGLASTNVGSN